MMTLKEIKTDTEHYFEDESGRKDGEFTRRNKQGAIIEQSCWKDGKRQGEFKRWDKEGKDVELHTLIVDDNKDEPNINLTGLTSDQIKIKALQHNVKFLS